MTYNIRMENQNKIKHIVCSGGGVTGFAFYGVIRESHKQGLWKFEDIETIYGTSVGSIFAVLLALNYDWDTMDDFLIKRPWQNVFKFNMYSLLESFQKKGIFDINSIRESFLPAFHGKDISIDITMKEFYEATNKEIHIFTTEVNSFQTVDISYKTHPDWKIVDAVYCSSAVPVVFAPHVINDTCYCDGGFLVNYPIYKCIEAGANPDEILGLTRTSDPEKEANKINSESSMLDYVILIINKLIRTILNQRRIQSDSSDLPEKTPRYEFIIKCPPISIYDIYNATTNIEERLRLIQVGVDEVQTWSSSTSYSQTAQES
jgi:predicted acylesterase/phospholipase RssA